MAKQVKPCKGCPFRRDSIPGFLGEASNEPERFLQTIEHSPIPCHLKIDWEETTQEEISKQAWKTPCVGSLQYQANQCKLPKEKKYDLMVRDTDKNPEVFQWRSEFIKHHE